MSRGNLRRSSMIYDATSRQHRPYSQISSIHNTAPHLVLPDLCDDSLERDLCYSDCASPINSRKLTDSLYVGSVSFQDYTLPHPNQNPPAQYSGPMRMEPSGNNCSPGQVHWDPITQPSVHLGSQPLLPSMSNQESNGGVGSRIKSKKPQGSSKRPTVDDFRNLVLRPQDHEALLNDYVGTDSKYALAKNHAGTMVRLSIKSKEMHDKMIEVIVPLDAIDVFLAFLLEHRGMKQEQKGCVALRICMGALSALMGEFSQANGVENFVSDPHAAVVPIACLGEFRSSNPKLCDVLRRLSIKLEKSMNLYRHRRSPSASLVAKFEEMSDTLNFWNTNLMDDTFLPPYRIASDWLKNHPNQVINRRRNQAYSEQASPSCSDTTRPSPTQYDSNYLSPISPYVEPSRPPNRSSMPQTVMDGSIYDDSLFRAPLAAGVTYFGSGSMPTSSMAFNPHLYRTTAGLGESSNLPPLTDELRTFTHQGHSANTGQYQGTGPGYPPYSQI